MAERTDYQASKQGAEKKRKMKWHFKHEEKSFLVPSIIHMKVRQN